MLYVIELQYLLSLNLPKKSHVFAVIKNLHTHDLRIIKGEKDAPITPCI